MIFICRGRMDLFIDNLNFKYGLMLWEERSNIIKEVKDKLAGELITVITHNGEAVSYTHLTLPTNREV